ncbi:putative aminoacrylate hydrolase RutD [Cocos nucifera]|uniref:Putative aminoacrylate hydrolase RutD n=1 Tax=Cocos nucifera TaxID=13894 RepID=A0A8K0IUG5_COCNU|nr:putative aminoacrylate hydrolase RutD [Cocos nucifera]
MAAAEARAAWQRAANRCLVQEDAKRAPKLACCPSSSMLQSDSSNGNATNAQDHSAPYFMPLNWNPMSSNLPLDAKWWLQLQPNFGHPRDHVCEQPNLLEDELDEKRAETTVPTSKFTEEPLLGESMDIDRKVNECLLESPCMVSTASMKRNSESGVEEMKTVTSCPQQPIKHKVDMSDYLYRDEELLDWKPVDRLISKKHEKVSSDLNTPWAGGNKNKPWWWISDKDELASLVAQKSQQHIENCDLPRPTQTVHVSGNPFGCLENLDANGIFASTLGQKLHAGICSPFDYAQNTSSTGSSDDKNWSSGGGYLLHDSAKLYSFNIFTRRDFFPLRKSSIFVCVLHGNQGYRTTESDSPEGKQIPEGDPSRAQLLEALRHSQTRARKAEMAAQKAYNEKNHIIKLLFRQASHLFAYKQWIHMLQLESLCLQLKIKDHPISTLFPVLPWMPLKGTPSSKDRNTRRKGRNQATCNICKYVVVFAFGLGLAGAGAMIACKLAAIAPERLCSLALLNATGGGFECFPKIDRQMISLAFRFLRAKTPEQRALVDLETHYTKEYLDEFVGSCTRRKILYQEYVKAISSTGMQSNCGFEGQINACWTHKMTPKELDTIRSSGFLVSVIHGRDDIIAQLSHARKLAEKLHPAARMVELHGGHLVSHERPEEVNQALKELIKASKFKLRPEDWSCSPEGASRWLVSGMQMSPSIRSNEGASGLVTVYNLFGRVKLCFLYFIGVFLMGFQQMRNILRIMKPVRVAASDS